MTKITPSFIKSTLSSEPMRKADMKTMLKLHSKSGTYGDINIHRLQLWL